MSRIIKSFADMFLDTHNFFAGWLGSIVIYFLPVFDVLRMLVFFFIIDTLIGYWKAHKLRGESFKGRIVWEKTITRLALSTLIILCAFSWDQVYSQDVIKIHMVIGGFISGVVLLSIVQNGYEISRWSVLKRIAKTIDKRLDDKLNEGLGDGPQNNEPIN